MYEDVLSRRDLREGVSNAVIPKYELVTNKEQRPASDQVTFVAHVDDDASQIDEVDPTRRKVHSYGNERKVFFR